MIVRFGTIEGERPIFFIFRDATFRRDGVLIAVEILAGIHDRRIGKPVGIDVVASAAEIVVGVPGVGGGEHRYVCARLRGRDNPWEREPCPIGVRAQR